MKIVLSFCFIKWKKKMWSELKIYLEVRVKHERYTRHLHFAQLYLWCLDYVTYLFKGYSFFLFHFHLIISACTGMSSTVSSSPFF
jgi:hypothetical protein